MTKQRPPSTGPTLPSGARTLPAPNRRKRRRARIPLLPTVGLFVGLSVCGLAASALFAPGYVFGGGSSQGTDLSPESPAVPAEPEGVSWEPSAVSAEPSAVTAESPGSAAMTVMAAASQGTALVTLRWGSGQGEVGLATPGEGLTSGPEAIAVSPDGRIAVLDTVNSRIVCLDQSGDVTGTIPIALAEPRFLAVNDERIYVLDCDNDRELIMVGWDGTFPSKAVLPELPDAVTGLFVTLRGPCVEIAHDRVFLLAAGDGSLGAQAANTGEATSQPPLRSIAGRPIGTALGRAVKATFRPGDGVRLRSFKLDSTSLAASPIADVKPSIEAGYSLEHLVSVDDDGSGGLIVGARLLDTGSRSSARPELMLTRLTPLDGSPRGGRVSGKMFLTVSPFAYVGQPYTVAPDGRVFQPVATSDGYTIVTRSFDQEEEARR